MSLLNDSSGLVNRFSVESVLGNSGLESAVEEFVKGKTKNVIELEFFSGEESISVHSSQEGSTFEQSSGVFFFKGEELTSSFSEFGEGKMDSPYFSLVLEPILANELEFVINPFLLVGSSWSLECGRV